MKKLYYILFLAGITFLPKVSLAVKTEVSDNDIPGAPEYISELIRKLMPIIVGISVLMIIYAGYIYTTSQGSPEQTTKAKDIIIGVVTGILLLFLIRVILDQIK